jgi:AAA family ATP:ADP antiporter
MSSSASAERDKSGHEYLASQPWRIMETNTLSSKANEYLEKAVNAISGELEGEDRLRVMWLSFTLFFTVGGYWLLRSIKDPIISTIDGVCSKS